MLMVVSSPDTVAPDGNPKQNLARVLAKISAQGNPVTLISNHSEPRWFKPCFKNTSVQFLQAERRQDGKIISIHAKDFSLQSYDCIVLASKAEDVQMGKNGGAVLIGADWSSDPEVQALGIKVESAAEFEMALNLSCFWQGQWGYHADMPPYKIRALIDLSEYGQTVTQKEFSEKLTNTVNQGGGCLDALLVVTARSLLIDGFGRQSDLILGIFPSSTSANNDGDTLSDFTHRLRTTVSRVRFAERGEPLFIRHKPSQKRSSAMGDSQTDPSDQVETIHLNPFYKNHLSGRHIIVVDDSTACGVSFGVAAAFLRKAGVVSITGVALGKFGDRTRYYNINIISDPFAPVGPKRYNVVHIKRFHGNTSNITQGALRNIIS